MPYMALNFLALMTCLTWTFFVAIRDLSTYQISNRSILLGAIFLWPALHLLDLRMHLSFALFCICGLILLFGLTSFIGMGDVKLMLLLAPWIQHAGLGFSFVLLIGFSWLQLIAISLIQRSFPKRIAFAPAILLAAALNMAT